MPVKKRKHQSGAAVSFLSRGKALRKLQLNLLDFRRLCILKGIYPVEPRHPKKASKGSSAPVTYYMLKDIQFLANEPIVKKLREYKVFVKKLRRAVDKKDPTKEKKLRKNKPGYTLDHIVKERYPSLVDALRDVDDALSICFLFAKMPKNNRVHSEQVRLCRRLTVEFLNYIVASKSLRKAFISIKGYQYEAEVLGHRVTWLMPHNVAYEHPKDVDYRIMASFVEFSTTLLGFLNFALYKSLELHYPPQVTIEGVEDSSYDFITEALSSYTMDLGLTDNDAPMNDFIVDDAFQEDQMKAMEEMEKLKVLFKGMKFFLNREVDRETFAFIIRCFGGEVSWDKSVLPLGATYECNDETVTHQIVDRPTVLNAILTRDYVQPQWVVDCVNAKKLLPVGEYYPGTVLPPHLSPFVVEEEGDYIPPEKIRLQEITVNGEVTAVPSKISKDLEPETEEPAKKVKKTPAKSGTRELKAQKVVLEGKILKTNSAQKMEEMSNQDKKLLEMSVHKKNRRLYNKVKFSEKKKKQEAETLAKKRKIIDQNK